MRRVDHLLHAAEQRGESGDEDSPRRFTKDAVERRDDHLFRRRVAAALAARGIGEERQHPLRAELAQPRKAWPAAAHRRVVELEVARVDDPAHIGGDAQPHAVRDRMGDRQELDLERADAEALARGDAPQVGAAGEIGALAEPRFDQAARQRRGVDRRVERHHLAQQIGQRADVILVAVRHHDAAHVAGPLPQIAEVGDHHVDAPHVVLGEHDPRIDDQDVAAMLEEHHVLADFPQAAEGDEAQGGCHGGASSAVLPKSRFAGDIIAHAGRSASARFLTPTRLRRWPLADIAASARVASSYCVRGGLVSAA